MSDIELKPCPFCGGEGKIVRYYRGLSPRISVQAECQKCGARSYGIEENPSYCADEKVAEAWNRRVEHE